MPARTRSQAKSSQKSHTHPWPTSQFLSTITVWELVIDYLQVQREQKIVDVNWECVLDVHGDKFSTQFMDRDLQSLSLLHRSCTRRAQHALGHSLVLHLGLCSSTRLERLQLVKNSPLYGTWTRRVHLLEGTYIVDRQKYVATRKSIAEKKKRRRLCWLAVQSILKSLENITSFTMNSSVQNIKKGILSALPYLHRVQDVTIFDENLLESPLQNHNEAVLQALLQLRNLTNIRLHRVEVTNRFPSTLSRTSGLDDVLRSCSMGAFSPGNCTFDIIEVTVAKDLRDATWRVDGLELYCAVLCGAGCSFGNLAGAMFWSTISRLEMNIDYVEELSGDGLDCLCGLFKVFTGLRYLRMNVSPGLFEAFLEVVPASLSPSVETVDFQIYMLDSIDELEGFDTPLQRFLETCNEDLRVVALKSLCDFIEDSNVSFPLSQSTAKRRNIELMFVKSDPYGIDLPQ